MAEQERTTKILEEFKDKVRMNNEPFQMKIATRYGIRHHSFMREKVGAATFIFARSCREESDLAIVSNWGYGCELMAIVTEKTIYIFSDFSDFDITSTDILPEGICLFGTAHKKMNDYVKNEIFAAFYNGLPTNNEIISENDYLDEARHRLLSRQAPEPMFHDDFFSDNDMIRILCGFLDPNVEAEKRLKEKESSWISKKTFETIVTKLIAEGKATEPWEITLANAIKSIDAKSLTAEFEYNGNIAVGKIKPNDILYNLMTKYELSVWDFATVPEGKRVSTELNVSSKNGRFACENITRILYRGKAIYERPVQK